MKFFDKKSNKTLLVGVYIPIMFDVVTEREQKPWKRFTYKIDPPIRMNFPISVPKDDDGADKKQYTMPDATFSLDETKNKNVFDDIGYLETKIRECLDTNAEFIRQKCDTLKREYRKLVDPDAPKPVFHPIIGTSKGRGPNETIALYRNLKARIQDDDYEDAFYAKSKIDRKTADGKDKPAKKFRSTVDFTMFSDKTMEGGKFSLKRDVNGRVLAGQGCAMTLQQVMEKDNGPQKPKGLMKVLAVPTVQFSKLVYSFSDNPVMGGIRMRTFLNSCSFIQIPKFERAEVVTSIGGESFTKSDFAGFMGAMPLQDTQVMSNTEFSEQAAKRQKTERAEQVVNVQTQVPMSLQTPPIVVQTPTLMDGVMVPASTADDGQAI